MIRLLDLLKEVGEKVKQEDAYPTVRVGHPTHANYYFNPKGAAKYVAIIRKWTGEGDDWSPGLEGSNAGTYGVAFGLQDRQGGVDFDATNKTARTGNLRRIMATVIGAVNDELEIDRREGNTISKIVIQPTKDKYRDKDERRLKLYLAYVKNNTPAGSKVSIAPDEDGEDTITIDLPTE